jgi:hypothetical protein
MASKAKTNATASTETLPAASAMHESDVNEADVLTGLLREAEDQSSTPAGRIRAWELIGKQLGMFRDRPRTEESEAVISFDIRL